MPRIILDAFAEAQFIEHFQIETGALFDALQFHQLVVLLKKSDALPQFGLDSFDRPQRSASGRYIMAGRIDGITRHFFQRAPGEWIEQRHTFHFIVEQRYAHCGFRAFRRKYIQYVSPHPEGPAREFEFIALILHFDQTLYGLALGNFFMFAQMQDHAVIIHRVADAVDA